VGVNLSQRGGKINKRTARRHPREEKERVLGFDRYFDPSLGEKERKLEASGRNMHRSKKVGKEKKPSDHKKRRELLG